MIRAKSFSKTLYNNNDKLYSTIMCTPISTSHHLPRNFQKFSRFKESDIGARDKNHKPNSIQYSSIHILPYLTTRKNLSSLSSIVEHRQRREISFFSGYFSPLFQKKKNFHSRAETDTLQYDSRSSKFVDFIFPVRIGEITKVNINT